VFSSIPRCYGKASFENYLSPRKNLCYQFSKLVYIYVYGLGIFEIEGFSRVLEEESPTRKKEKLMLAFIIPNSHKAIALKQAILACMHLCVCSSMAISAYACHLHIAVYM
jgi:hypothetical protein